MSSNSIEFSNLLIASEWSHFKHLLLFDPEYLIALYTLQINSVVISRNEFKY
jgi:hypothetical protein